MTITCFIRYEIDPFQKDQFKTYAHNWARSTRPPPGWTFFGLLFTARGQPLRGMGRIAFPAWRRMRPAPAPA